MARDSGNRWRRAILAGLVIALLDTLTHLALVINLPADWQSVIVSLDFVASILIFWWIGSFAGRLTGLARPGAELGALAGGLAGAIDVLVSLGFPVPSDVPLAQQLIGLLSQNLFLGGVLGLLAAWFASRQRVGPPPVNDRR